jgi:hypothetical protein
MPGDDRGPGGETRTRAAAGLLHPVPLVAMAVLALNDHWGKTAWPGWVTGKLSDVAGLAFFPLVLQAAWEVIGRRAPSRRTLVVATVLTLGVFVSIKTLPAATTLWAWALGGLQWPARWLFVGTARPVPVAAVTDPTDLVALPAVALAVWAGWGRSGAGAPRGR